MFEAHNIAILLPIGQRFLLHCINLYSSTLVFNSCELLASVKPQARKRLLYLHLSNELQHYRICLDRLIISINLGLASYSLHVRVEHLF